METIGMVVLFFILCVSNVACTTTRVSESVLEHQRAIGAVATERAILDGAIESSLRGLDTSVERLKDLARRSADMGGTIEELIQLFEEYDKGVEQLVRDYNNLKTRTNSDADSGRSSLATTDMESDMVLPWTPLPKVPRRVGGVE